MRSSAVRTFCPVGILGPRSLSSSASITARSAAPRCLCLLLRLVQSRLRLLDRLLTAIALLCLAASSFAWSRSRRYPALVGAGFDSWTSSDEVVRPTRSVMRAMSRYLWALCVTLGDSKNAACEQDG
jgi:hypothetical protein